MDLPDPTVIRDFHSDLDQTFGDLGPLKNCHDGTVKFGVNGLFLLYTSPVHPISLNFT